MKMNLFFAVSCVLYLVEQAKATVSYPAEIAGIRR
jgi:hypothetical protein